MKLRGYLHVHSTYSYDGKVALADLKAGLKADRIQFVCVTEHTDWLTQERFQAFFEECHRLSDESILLIPGLEVSFPNAHIILAGLPSSVDPQETPLELVQRGQAMGAFVVFAHPHRSRFQAPTGVEELLHGVEIWNGQYDGKRTPRTAAWDYRDRLAKQHGRMFITGGIDFHRWSHTPGPCLEVQVSERTEEALILALRQGDYHLTGSGLTIASTESLSSRLDQASLRRRSTRSIRFIALARALNAALARVHLRLPKGFRERIRKRV